MASRAVAVKATALTPFAYHSLPVQDGTATLPELISDAAVCFGLASALGMATASVALPPKDYRRHLGALPFRSSVLWTEDPRLLPPLARRLNVDEEGGYQQKVRDVVYKGNLKSYFHIQEVPPGQTFCGALFGLDGDPLERWGGSREVVIRVGLHRGGMVRLEAVDEVRPVRLNVATAALFGRGDELRVDRYCLYNLQLTGPMPLEKAAESVGRWR